LVVCSVSYVAISGQVAEKLVREATEHPEEQVVGVLLGGQFGSTISIEDAATGPADVDATKATLTGDSIARIADDIINKRIRGSIVGWYHSHVRGGVFMSETDVETQLKLQQFSPLVTAMVIDAQTGTSGFFRADPKTREVVSVPSQNARAEVSSPVSTSYYAPERATYPQYPAPVTQGPSTRTLLLALLIITLAVTGGILALVYYRNPEVSGSTGNLSITHSEPKGPFTIGSAITIDANVTGSNLLNVTLAYKIIEAAPNSQGGLIIGDLAQVPMLPRSAECTTTTACTYSYTLQSSEISGLYVQYYISVFDTASPPNIIRTDIFNLNVGDFSWRDDKTEIVAIRQAQTGVSIPLDSINGFNDLITIRILTQPPLGVRIVPISAQVRPPNAANLIITSTDSAQISYKYPIQVDAVYTIRNVQVIRSTTLQLTLTDINIAVSPTYAKTTQCYASDSCADSNEFVQYTVTLTVYDGFTAPNGIQLFPSGLPNHTSYQILLVSQKIGTDETQTLTYSLIVRADLDSTVNRYLFSMVVKAGAITHSVDNIQFEIVD